VEDGVKRGREEREVKREEGREEPSPPQLLHC